MARKASTYRGARRNAAKGQVWRGIQPKRRKYHPPVRANRSRKRPNISPQEAESMSRHRVPVAIAAE